MCMQQWLLFWLKQSSVRMHKICSFVELILAQEMSGTYSNVDVKVSLINLFH